MFEIDSLKLRLSINRMESLSNLFDKQLNIIYSYPDAQEYK